MIDALVTFVVLLAPGAAFVVFGAILFKRSESAYLTLAARSELVPAWVRRLTRFGSGLFILHGIALTMFGIFLAWCVFVPQ